MSTQSRLYILVEYGYLVVGCFILACTFNYFLNPNQIASGGVSGLSTILFKVTGLSPAITQWLFNIPLFVLGWIILGKKYGMKVLAGTIALPLFVLLTSHVHPLTDNLLLAAIFGGLGVGIGIGIVFRGRGSTGGFSVAAQILHHYTGITLGLCVAVFDGMVIVIAGLVFSPEKAMYALIALFVTMKTIDLVQTGLRTSKVAFIITDHVEDMRLGILNDLDRGLTQLNAVGGYTGDQKTVLMVVVSQNTVIKLKHIVKSVDPTAFVILSDTAEVLGEGFKQHV
ncbi:YitT family protein [Paenibacillus albiflavus]|uniref:YitT family protein n=1 Tax=Paenibacillus albiflavus TaxID=2545760 RepID=A0A4R4EAJ6_9BACL|nr:YitT family protein [Paenibacillus albiflavus]